MNIKEQLNAALKRAQELSTEAAERDLTDDELVEVKSLTESIDGLKAQAKKADDDAALVKRLGGFAMPSQQKADDEIDAPERTLGEHFAKHAGTAFRASKGINGAVVSAPEWVPGGAKANTDTQVTGSGFSGVLTQVDRTIVTGVRPRLVVADLLGSGVMGPNTNAVTYFVEGALEGTIATVAENGQKPQIHFVDPTTRTDALKKIAAWWNESDEMIEDLDYYVAELNRRATYELMRTEEQQLLNGAGTGSTVTGILNRSGIQTESAANNTDNEDALFRAMTKVSTGAGLDADGIVMHPTDYQRSRLRKDSNNQYYGGGYFQNEYGVGGIPLQPPIWGLRTVVTPAIAAGTALVGAFQAAATVYRKGGIRVEATNSHASNFTLDVVTTRIEERVALAVRAPAGFVAVTLSTTAPA